MLVGAQLRRLREARNISSEEAGEAIRASPSKISRLELGRTGFKRRDVADLMTLYGVTEDAEREALLALVEQANAPGWWHAYADVVPAWSDAYLGLEQAASLIRCYDAQFVPELLQTEDYARALIRAGHAEASEAEIERRVELRMGRRHLLRRPEPVSLWVVVDEAALRRRVGGTEVMRAQLRHLIEAAELGHVTVQVLPFAAGAGAGATGSAVILRFPEGELSDIVYLEQPTGALYLDKPADVERHWHIMNRLGMEAERPDATVAVLRRVLAET
ncbi:transcriptional regulator with XRE-family HTH domain [Streptosporangium becharense]|uniref:Transcriptional regulator with XRE-family HTH domain n=1 Tax=Streptosporangium becharense TaxID=1816182 RepID=A0A7W9ME38_9ACTN|nr:helix-turn-helix transcriptional regulator [Streptosporangium becharense]MBB2910862.1 transcriptional regulator with XRE-family HTH domain [Streptosporangium becharense]MBB5817557.1 transcriptional regulator with XRE-family HTH domain [Streptosporangium becharense]